MAEASAGTSTGGVGAARRRKATDRLTSWHPPRVDKNCYDAPVYVRPLHVLYSVYYVQLILYAAYTVYSLSRMRHVQRILAAAYTAWPVSVRTNAGEREGGCIRAATYLFLRVTLDVMEQGAVQAMEQAGQRPAAGKEQDSKEQDGKEQGHVQTAKTSARSVAADLKSMCEFVAYCGVPLTTLQRALDSTSAEEEEVVEVTQVLLQLVDSKFDARNVRALQLLLSSPFVQGSPAEASAKFLDHFVARKNWRMVLECLLLVYRWTFADTFTSRFLCSCLKALTECRVSPHDETNSAIQAQTEWIVDASFMLSTPDVLTALCRLWVVDMRSASNSFKFANVLMFRLQKKQGYAAALKNVQGLECAVETMQRGPVAPETQKALWDMTALLDNKEFQEFLDAHGGFARRLLHPSAMFGSAAFKRMTALDKDATQERATRAEERATKAEERAKSAEERATKAEERVAAMAAKIAAMNQRLRDCWDL